MTEQTFEEWWPISGHPFGYSSEAEHDAIAEGAKKGWDHQQRIIDEKDAEIAEMIVKAAAKHRPAYDEQQRRIAELEAQVKGRCACQFEDGACVEPCKYHAQLSPLERGHKRMTRHAFDRTINEDIQWLRDCPHTLERQHIERLLLDAGRVYYPATSVEQE